MNANDRISKIIEYSALSSSEFADEIEVPRSSISHITAGRNKPSLDFLIKVKDRFPELQWDWLIKGNGEMLKTQEEPSETIVTKVKVRSTSLPDLFSLIDDENFGITESEDRTQKTAYSDTTVRASESAPAASPDLQKNSDDSQRLGSVEASNIIQNTDNQQNKIKRIVLFYENGRFESFEP